MIKRVKMPKLSPTMEEGNIVKWYKKEGDNVSSGDLLVEVETDKATMGFESNYDGVLGKILFDEGAENVKVGDLLCVILEEDDDSSAIDLIGVDSDVKSSGEVKPSEFEEVAYNASKTSDTKTSDTKSDHYIDGSKIKISPLAKKIAVANSIDITTISGSGPYGRIIKSDVVKLIDNSVLSTKDIDKDIDQGGSVQSPKEDNFEYIALTNMRKIIARRLLESKQSIPHFYLTIDCCIDELLALRSEINQAETGDEKGSKITVNDFIIKAISIAMLRVPYINVSWDGNRLIKYNNVDISVAIAVDGGLVVPVLRCVDCKSLTQISSEVRCFIAKAKSGKILPEDSYGGGFTVSNLGMYGIKSFSAIINPPQSCILAVGAIDKRPVVRDNSIVIANMMTVTLSVDHRAVDGVIGAEFLKHFKYLLANPMRILV